MTWAALDSPGRVNAIRALLADSPRARDQDIADKLGASRDSISWYIRTYEIERPMSGSEKRRKLRKPPRPKTSTFVFGRGPQHSETLPPSYNLAAFRALPGAPSPVLLEHLPSGCCHWPVDEPPHPDGKTRHCGLPAPDGRYCEHHTKASGHLVPRLVLA